MAVNTTPAFVHDSELETDSPSAEPVHTLWAGGFEMPEHFKANIGFETMIGDRSQWSIDVLFSQSNNSPYSCCTASGGFTGTSIGVFGPNDIGGIGEFDKGWGRSDFSREHTFVFTAIADFPWGIQASAIMRSQSGRPWSPVGDEKDRQIYADLLEKYSCIGDHVGEILERNTCRSPWTHQLDMRFSKAFNTVGRQRVNIEVDLFNVLNGIGRLFCDDDDPDVDFTSGTCGWGRWTGVFGADTDLIAPAGFDEATQRILYDVNETFGTEGLLGNSLVLQIQAQIGVRYFF